MDINEEFFISVDIETAGPNPGDYSLLSIGACTLEDPPRTFYIELCPVKPNFTREALEISGLSLEELKKAGVPPGEAMKRFERWLQDVVPVKVVPIFTAFNAPFDWMFIHEYFLHYVGYNPFGYKALDIKAMYMGARKTSWADTTYNEIRHALGFTTSLTHHALEDALQQAEVLKLLLKEIREKRHE